MRNPLTRYYQGTNPWVVDRTLFLCVHGSRAYGTNTPESDTDLKGVCVAPKINYLGMEKAFEQVEFKRDELDTEGVVYEFRKFVRLAADCNPNIVEVLWVDDADRLYVHPQLGENLLNVREKFLSRKVRYTFSGYATSQLKRVKLHRRWLLDPPEGKPAREDFGLTDSDRPLTKGEVGAFDALVDKGATFGDAAMTLLGKEKAYHGALNEWKQFKHWEKIRNPKRAALEAEFGYDTKHGMHLVRLLSMCQEMLVTGKVNVRRPDRDMLMAVRSGEWTYDELVEWAERKDKEMDVWMMHSPLPETTDKSWLNQWTMCFLDDALRVLG